VINARRDLSILMRSEMSRGPIETEEEDPQDEDSMRGMYL
jgi:hypothetical protein